MSTRTVDTVGSFKIGLPEHDMGRPNAARIHQQLAQYWKYAPAGWEVQSRKWLGPLLL
jgi:hypothetical protein